jgi:hypothetical protein
METSITHVNPGLSFMSTVKISEYFFVAQEPGSGNAVAGIGNSGPL